MKLTSIVEKGKNGYLISQIKEIPEVFTQSITIQELRENMADALKMYMEDVRKRY